MLQLSSTALFCGRASPDKLRNCGRGGHLRSEACAAGLAPFLRGGRPGGARPSADQKLGARRCGPDGADARLASPIARRMSSPAAKTASPVLASGLIGCGGKSEAWFAVLVCRTEGDAPEG